jgi:hypothetical protein
MNDRNREFATIVVVVTTAMMAWGFLLFELTTRFTQPTWV